MRYLHRDQTGVVIGHYANPQGFDTERVPDDHPDLLAWTAKRKQVAPITISNHEARLAAIEKILGISRVE